MKKKYSFSIPESLSSCLCGGLTAEQIGEEFERISDLYGKLTAENIVAEAEKEDCILHSCFEWDDTKAALQYRIKQATTLIRSIKVEIKNEKVECSVRAFVNVREKKKAPRSYIPVEHAILNDYAYQDLLQQAKKDMQSFIDNYSQLEELNSVKAEMLKAINTI